MRIILSSNPYRDRGLRTALEADRILREGRRGDGAVSALCPQEGGAAGSAPSGGPSTSWRRSFPKADLLVCFGGDGTIPSRRPGRHPPRGAHPGGEHGQRGLHGGAGADGALPAGPLAKGHFVTEERMMLDIRLLLGRNRSARTWP